MLRLSFTIIAGTRYRITQEIICLRNLLELLLTRRIFVRVTYEGLETQRRMQRATSLVKGLCSK